MEPMRKLRWERPAGIAAEPARPDPLTSLVRLVRTPRAAPETAPASPEDWAGLIDRVRVAASRTREAEAHAIAREREMQDMVRHVRAEAEAAEARVREAEIRAAAAEARAEQADARAQAAEAWLLRIHETVASEFAPIDREEGR